MGYSFNSETIAVSSPLKASRLQRDDCSTMVRGGAGPAQTPLSFWPEARASEPYQAHSGTVLTLQAQMRPAARRSSLQRPATASDPHPHPPAFDKHTTSPNAPPSLPTTRSAHLQPSPNWQRPATIMEHRLALRCWLRSCSGAQQGMGGWVKGVG